MTPIVNTVHFPQLHIVKTGRIALFVAAGFARVTINAVSRVPVNLCTNLCYHMQAEGGVRAT